ncbi:homoserine kinase [Clostridium sp.]|uniref:homoserine kinase n=1 Tax=Clostridium sp. TaxID=1506 RepID=UPI003F38815C
MVRVRVPATSANIGPGFDSLGIAFDLYNVFEFEEIEKGLVFEDIPQEFCNEDNIIYIAMKKCFLKANYNAKGLKIKAVKQDIPISRGLGSSSSCIVAGLMGANFIMGNKLSKDEIFNIGVEMEGHPDNIAPAVFGGMVVSVMEEGKTVYNKLDIKDGISFIGLIPDFRLETEKARNVLPKEVSLKDSIFNLSRSALIVSCFITGRYDLLKFACKDALHQKYRSKLIDNFDNVYGKCFDLGALGCFLSGAGPTIMAIIDNKDKDFIGGINNYLYDNNIFWLTKTLNVDNIGACII